MERSIIATFVTIALVAEILWIGVLTWGASAALSSNLSQASYYGPGFYGNHTKCGQVLHTWTPGIAHRSLPCGTKVRICRGERCVTTHVIDRGPFVYSRDLDLTAATAARLCNCNSRNWGVRLVSWKVVR